MKYSIFLLFFLIVIFLSSTSLAESIAISPNIINLGSKEASFIILNSNTEKIEYEIISSSNKLELLENKGTIPANSNKKIYFKTSSELTKEEYITISFSSTKLVTPSITIKLVPNYQEEDLIHFSESLGLIKTDEITRESKITNDNLEIGFKNINAEDNFFDENTLYLLGTIFVLLLTIIFSKNHNKRYRTGHIRQNLRMFIKKFTH